MKKIKVLTTFQLCGNPITQKGAMLILQAIEKMTSSGINEIDIKVLSIYCRWFLKSQLFHLFFGEGGIINLKRMVGKNKTFIEMRLGYAQIG